MSQPLISFSKSKNSLLILDKQLTTTVKHYFVSRGWTVQSAILLNHTVLESTCILLSRK